MGPMEDISSERADGRGRCRERAWKLLASFKVKMTTGNHR